MAQTNQDQAEYWNGDVGQRWAASQRILDAVFAPLTAALFESAALRAGSECLDIGCGAGETALAAARQLGSHGRVTALDLSAPLLAVARSRVPLEAAAGAPIDWIEADAQTYDLGNARFECALSRFGVMFFEDSRAAFANIRRSLVPGGRISFLCWRSIAENAWVSIPREVVLRLVPDDAPLSPDAPGPFRFANAETPVAILEAAGFRTITCDSLDRALILGRSADGSAREAAASAAGLAVDLGPVSRLLRERDPALREIARAELTETFLRYAEAGAVSLGAACWLISAQR